MSSLIAFWFSARTLHFRRPQTWPHGDGYDRGRILLELESVFVRSVVAVRPQMATRGSIDES